MKKKIVFLPVPANFYDQFAGEEWNEFIINPDIPIPAEIDDGDENTSIASLSTEMILSAMLRVIEEAQVDQEWIDYYCSLVIYLRPDILTTIKEMKENGLTDENYIHAHDMVRNGKPKEGLSYIRDFLENYPHSWNGWFILGWALRLLCRWQDAAAALKKAIELGGGNSDTRNELAICLMESGNLTAAKQELEKALRHDTENVKIISNLGVLAHKSGDRETATAFFRTALDVDKDDPVAKSYLKNFSQ